MMANFLTRLSSRLPVLRNSMSAPLQSGTDLTAAADMHINSLSGPELVQSHASTSSIPEPSAGAMPCAMDPLACTAAQTQSLPDMTGPEVDDRQLCPRRHRRHHHRSRRSRLCRIKCKEVNFAAAMCSIVSAVLICTSLYEPHWWYIGGSRCRDNLQAPVNYLSVRQFFYEGLFINDNQQEDSYYYGNAQSYVLKNCVNPSTVFFIKSVIILCFVTIIFNLAAVLLDIVSFASRVTKVIRNYAVFSILSVINCVIINILSYVVTNQLVQYYNSQLNSSPLSDGGDRVDVEFGLCFYLIMGSGIVSVIAVASNLLCRHGVNACSFATAAELGSRPSRRRHDERLLENDYSQYGRSFAGGPTMPVLPPPYEP